MSTYLIVSAIILIILGLSWSKKDFFNFLVKVALILIGCVGVFYYLQTLGYIVKI